MHIFGPEERVYRSNLKVARQRLAAVPDDAPEEIRGAANAAVVRAEGFLEWWQRLDIDAGIYDEA